MKRMCPLVNYCKNKKLYQKKKVNVRATDCHENINNKKRRLEDTEKHGTSVNDSMQTGQCSKNSKEEKMLCKESKPNINDELDLNSTLEGSIIQHDINNVDLSYLDFGIGEVFLEKWLLLHKIDGNSRRGVSYLVHDGIKLEGILRAEPLSSPHNTVMNEAIFLEKQSLANKSYLFNEVLDLKRVNEDSKNGFTYIVTLFRHGPTLQQCLNFAYTRSRRFEISYGTVGRIAVDLLSILETSFKLGFAFRNIHIGQFSFDVRSRRVYMHDRTDIVISKERRNFPILETANMYWIGCPEHAPLDWHLKGKKSHMCELDCLESFFYLILDMLGVLPWKGENVKEIPLLKKRWSTNMMLSSHSHVIPQPMISFWLELSRVRSIEVSNLRIVNGLILLSGPRGGARISLVDYKSLNGALESLYATLGGVRDWDEPYDFEVEIGKSPREYLVAKIVRTIDKVDFALGELEALEMRTQYKTSEDIQMEKEIRRNALFIDRYIQKDLINEDGQNSEVIISED